MLVILEAVSGPVAGRRIEVREGTSLRIGRSSKSDYAIGEDSYLSGQHFAVECDGAQCRVRDLGSSNGTFLNGDRIVERIVQEGDSLAAGRSMFTVRIQASVRQRIAVAEVNSAPTLEYAGGPASLRDGPSRDGFSPAQSILLDALYRDGEPLYAVLDALKDARIPVFLDASGERHARVDDTNPLAPYLVVVPPQSRLLDVLVKDGWNQGWGFYFTARIGFEDVLYHWRSFLTLRNQNGQAMSFRFWDPRVLRAILPAMETEEAGAFFGLLSRFIVEGESPGTAVEFSLGPRGARRQSFVLV
ncbi:MAG TPA: DUF4123 domain-containing protein [Bryobacteraceae bacterium]|nr:DUF4123 domain-containing protein [Bryobacteraceae bacterium]